MTTHRARRGKRVVEVTLKGKKEMIKVEELLMQHTSKVMDHKVQHC